MPGQAGCATLSRTDFIPPALVCFYPALTSQVPHLLIEPATVLLGKRDVGSEDGNVPKFNADNLVI
ncbi:hypothetical protein Pla22_39920 [Rubripirellula amarantea]|uniref:Uncharacterized protein n=1 Tax=Rubripirellula amarantea TaxID=2527999 RepID=A0A5C5WM21_9BACT|nr:hypothetical protein Pla22_39920 [Rubripirellula amarantea]